MLDLRTDARMAGRVIRYHTWPHIRQQTVGEHSWQVLRILLSLWPECPAHVVRHAVMHDVGELRVGDPPYPVKADNPVLQREMDRLEQSAVDEIASTWDLPVPGLEGDDKWIFKLAEFIEMWEWGLEESLMGNKFADLVAFRCKKVAETRLKEKQDELNAQFAKDGSYVPWLSDAIHRAEVYMRKRSFRWET